MQDLIYSISISFISWIVGMVGNALIKNTSFYSNKLSNLRFIKQPHLYTAIGLTPFKWVVKNTFFKYFNQQLKLNNKTNLSDLEHIRREMTVAEVSHLIAFVFVMVVAVYKAVTVSLILGVIMMVVNVVMNLYPSLLQQQNKIRIDRAIVIYQRYYKKK